MRELLSQTIFVIGLFALLMTALTNASASEDLPGGLYVKAHPIPLIEAQPTLGLD